MVAYEFYWRNPRGGSQVMGVLHERRKNFARVTRESIMRWGQTIFNKDLDNKDIFIRVTIDEKTIGIFQPIPFSL
jgi:hypothetical protein